MKHKKVGARLFSALMTLTLVLGLLPVTALAEEAVTKTYEEDYGFYAVTLSSETGTLPEGKVSYTIGNSRQPENIPNVDVTGIKNAILQKYESAPEFEYTSLSIVTEDGKAAELPSDAEIQSVKVLTTEANPKVFTYANGTITEIEGVKYDSDSFCVTFKPGQLNDIIVMDADSLVEKTTPQPVTKTYEEDYGFYAVTLSSESGTLPEGKVSYTIGNSRQPENIPNLDVTGIKNAILQKYESAPEFEYTSLSIVTEDGKAAELPSDAEIQSVKVLTTEANPKVFTYANGTITEIEGVKYDSDSFCVTFKPGQLNDIIVMDADSLVEKENQWKAGVYTVTADLYVDGEDNEVLKGVTAYLSNNINFPPTTSLEYNGKLVIGEDGSLTLTVKNLNNIFTLQNIDSGDNVEILDRIIEKVDLKKYDSRICGLVLNLKDTSGHYSFTNCKEYPTILQEDKNMPIQLSVDFKNMKQGFDETADVTSKTFKDEKTNSTVVVSSSA